MNLFKTNLQKVMPSEISSPLKSNKRDILKFNYEENPSVYETEAVLCSVLVDGAFEKKYKPWKFRFLDIRSNGEMLITKDFSRGVQREEKEISEIVNIKSFVISVIEIKDSSSEQMRNKVGIKVECSFPSGIQTNFRCLMRRTDVVIFCNRAKSVAKQLNNIDSFLESFTSTIQENEDNLFDRKDSMRPIHRLLDKQEVRDVRKRILER